MGPVRPILHDVKIAATRFIFACRVWSLRIAHSGPIARRKLRYLQRQRQEEIDVEMGRNFYRQP